MDSLEREYQKVQQEMTALRLETADAVDRLIERLKLDAEKLRTEDQIPDRGMAGVVWAIDSGYARLQFKKDHLAAIREVQAEEAKKQKT